MNEAQQATEGGAPQQDSTGTLVDQSKPEATSTETKPGTTDPAESTGSKADTSEKSLLNKDAPKPDASVPEKYSDFKVPEGYVLDAPAMEEAGPLFKELKLSQDQAQKLVDFYSKHALASFKAATDTVVETNRRWADETKAHFGSNFDSARTTISKALNSLGDTALEGQFRQAMDDLGAGNHPVFAKVLHKFAERLTEGTAVKGNSPSTHGQVPAGQARRTAAAALYPNLPSQG